MTENKPHKSGASKKSFVHTTRLTAEAETSPTIIHRERGKKGVRYYEGVTYAPDGTVIFGDEVEQGKIKITRASTELSGAYLYLFNFLDYVCTHAPDLVKLDDETSVYHYSVNAPWEKFLEITLGNEYANQKKLLQDELYRLIHEARPKIIPFGDGTSIYGQPFIVTLQSRARDELSKIELTRLDNIGQESSIGFIQIFFSKPLFRDVLTGTDTGRFLNMPKQFAAMIIDKAHQLDQAQKNRPDVQEFLYGQPLLFPPDISGAHNIATYMRLYYYICLHDNNKGDYITLSLPDLVSHVCPKYAQVINDKLYIYNKKAVEEILTSGISIFSSLNMTAANFAITGMEGHDADLSIRILIKRRHKSKLPEKAKDDLSLVKITFKKEPV
jgi:hypothetical protein